MLAFILTRLAQAVLVMAVVALLAFAMFRFVGDPINQLVGVSLPTFLIGILLIFDWIKKN